MVRVEVKQRITVNNKWVLPGENLVLSEAVYRQTLATYPDSLQLLEPLREILGAEPIAEETKLPPPATSSKKRVVSSEPKSS